MSSSLEDILVICDLDNTLLKVKDGILGCNKATIELFTRLGGKFTISTSRSPESVKRILGNIKLSCPAIVCGGAMLYDLTEGRCLKQHVLKDEKVKAFTKEVAQKFPDIGIQIYSDLGRLYIAQCNRYTQKHLLNEQIGCIISPLDMINCNWLKVVFAADPISIAKLRLFLKTKECGSFRLLEKEPTCCEIVSDAIDKVHSIEYLCSMHSIPIENTIAIGDCDIETMRAAGYAVAVANAPLEIKLEADKVISSCEDGGVGEYLYSLIQRYT